jgi:histone H3/H4
MLQHPTSKTAKKRAGLPPLRIPAASCENPSNDASDTETAQAEGQEGTLEPTLSVKPAITKRKTRRQFEIPRVTFRRLVHEIVAERKPDLRVQNGAFEALQEAAEALVSERFSRCSQLVDLCKLDTVRDEHWRFVQNEAMGATVPC